MIRRAEDKDIARILELLVQVDMVHHNIRPDLFKGPATKYNAEELKKIFRDDESPVFVYIENETVLGYAMCQTNRYIDDNVMTDIKTLYIDDVCVDEKSRGLHIGRALFEHVVKYAKNKGYYNITLNVWEGNDGARAFYDRMGMKPYKYCMETIL